MIYLWIFWGNFAHFPTWTRSSWHTVRGQRDIKNSHSLFQRVGVRLVIFKLWSALCSTHMSILVVPDRTYIQGHSGVHWRTEGPSKIHTYGPEQKMTFVSVFLLLCWRSWEVAGRLHHPGGFWQQLHIYEHQRQPLLPRRVTRLRPGWAGVLSFHPGRYKQLFEHKWNHVITASQCRTKTLQLSRTVCARAAEPTPFVSRCSDDAAGEAEGEQTSRGRVHLQRLLLHDGRSWQQPEVSAALNDAKNI